MPHEKNIKYEKIWKQNENTYFRYYPVKVEMDKLGGFDHIK